MSRGSAKAVRAEGEDAMRREHWLWTVLAGLGLGLFAAGTAVYGQETGDRGAPKRRA
jgi:hypothetical protein